MKISFIIPCYNRSSVIEECLDSIFFCDIDKYISEIIIVDDGSKDFFQLKSKVSILKKKYPSKIMLLNLERNRGVSNARNVGIQYVTGDYVWFVDSDDVIFKDGVSRMVRLLLSYKPDIYRFSWRRRDVDEEWKSFKNKPINTEKFYILKDCSQRELSILVKSSLLCNAVYKSEIIKQNKFNIRIHNGEDRLFATEVLMTSSNVLFDLENICYGYTKTNGSASFQVSKKMFWGYVRVSIILVDLLKKMCVLNSNWELALSNEIRNFYVRMYSQFGNEIFSGLYFLMFKLGYYKIMIQSSHRNFFARKISLFVYLCNLPVFYKIEYKFWSYLIIVKEFISKLYC